MLRMFLNYWVHRYIKGALFVVIHTRSQRRVPWGVSEDVADIGIITHSLYFLTESYLSILRTDRSVTEHVLGTPHSHMTAGMGRRLILPDSQSRHFRYLDIRQMTASPSWNDGVKSMYLHTSILQFGVQRPERICDRLWFHVGVWARLFRRARGRCF